MHLKTKQKYQVRKGLSITARCVADKYIIRVGYDILTLDARRVRALGLLQHVHNLRNLAQIKGNTKLYNKTQNVYSGLLLLKAQLEGASA